MNKYIVAISLSVIVNFFAAGMDKPVEPAYKQYQVDAQTREQEFRAMSDAGNYVTPRSEQRIESMQQRKKLEEDRIRLEKDRAAEYSLAKMAHNKLQSMIQEENKEFERELRKQSRQFGINREIPIYNEILFNVYMQQGRYSRVVDLLAKDENLRTKYQPARELYEDLLVVNNQINDVRSGKIITGMFVKLPTNARNLFPEIEKEVLQAAKDGNNIGFLNTYKIVNENDALRKKVEPYLFRS